MQHTTTYYAILSGGCAAAASLCGKLSGLPSFQGPLVLLRILFFGLMILSNGLVWTLYVKALQTSDSSLSATILSATSNFFLSALTGFLIFGETNHFWWWIGMVLILLGLVLIARDEAKLNLNMLQSEEGVAKKKKR